MQTLTSFVRMEITVLLAALALIIAFQLLTGKINVQGLLLEKTGGADKRAERTGKSLSIPISYFHFRDCVELVFDNRG